MTTTRLPKGFSAFLATCALGAFNDNFYKMLLQLYVLVVAKRPDAEAVIAQASFVFTLPFVLFGPWSGYLADRFAKHRLMQMVKAIEIGIMLIGLLAFTLDQVSLMLAVIFLLATHSTFFSPAKAGLIPETCATELITRANSLLGLSTFLAIIFGTALAGLLLSWHDNRTTVTAGYCVGLAIAGLLVSFGITQTRTIGTRTAFPRNPLRGILDDLRFLKRQKGLFLASLAISYFWFLGLVFQSNILVYGTRHLGLTTADNARLALLPALLGIGIALGSLLASRWSGKKVELGLTPLGGIGLTLGAMALALYHHAYVITAVILFGCGVCGALFIIPLVAFLQFQAEAHEKGRVLATNGVLNGIFLVGGSVCYRLFAVECRLEPAQIFLVMSIVTLAVTVYICTIIPEYFIRFLGWLLTHTFYRITIRGAEQVPFQGPALLVPNHVSFVDALLVGATIQRFIKFIMHKKIYDRWGIRQLCRLMEVIPIAPHEGRASVTHSLETAREKLRHGEIVCIFAEGGITRDAKIQEFKRGMETVMEGMQCPIIPVYLHNVWGSIFSFAGGKIFWKWPRQIPYPVTVCYGTPLPPHATASEVQVAVEALATRYGVDVSR